MKIQQNKTNGKYTKENRKVLFTHRRIIRKLENQFYLYLYYRYNNFFSM